METGILPPELKTIEQLFTGDARYSVPQYQRSFAWGKDEIEELWDDLISASKRGSEYFLGTIVVQKTSVNEFEIIDGQQRLTCLTMIFSAIRNVFLAAQDERAEQVRMNFLGAKNYSRNAPIQPKLVLNRVNNEIFVQHVISSDNLENVKKFLRARKPTHSNRLLLEAYVFFLDKISSEAAQLGTQSDGFIEPLIECLRLSVKLIAITVLSGEDANLFFESLNARGKELAVSDLVKNRLFSEAATQVGRAQRLWENMEAELIRKPIPEYLRHFWIARKADDKNPIVREKQLYRLIVEEVKGKQENTLKLLGELAESARDYVKIGDYTLWPDDDAYDKAFEESINELQLFRVTQCNPLLLNALQVLAKPKEVTKVFRIVANFSFRYFIIGNQSPGDLEREMNKIAYGIRSGTLSTAKEIADAFRSINSAPTFRSDFALASLPRSRAKIARYALAKINNHLARRSGSQNAEYVVNPDSKQVTLEHILPQSLPDGWKADFTNSTNPADYVDRIGNLTLLYRKSNTEIGDSSFKEKKLVALNRSVLEINKNSFIGDKWGNEEIDKRQDYLSKVAVEVWEI